MTDWETLHPSFPSNGILYASTLSFVLGVTGRFQQESDLGSYIVRRVFAGVITMVLITLAVFILLRLGGGNPVEYMLPPEATQPTWRS